MLTCLSGLQLSVWSVFTEWRAGLRKKDKKKQALTFRACLTVVVVAAQPLSCVRLCDPKDCSIPGFLVLRHLPDSAQTCIHWVSDAIQPSHPLSPPSPPAFNLSHHHDLFQWVGTSHQVDTKFWSFNFSINPSVNIQGYLGLTGLIFLQSQGLWRISSSTTIWKQQFFWHSAFF